MSCNKKPLVKVLILGDGGVGKTSILRRFLGHPFQGDYKATIGIDCEKKEMKIDGKDIVLDIWDSAGQERFRSVSPSFYRGCDCCVLVYDVTDSKSFAHLDEWRDEVLVQSNLRDPERFPFIVFGNKLDLTEDKQISTEQLSDWATKSGDTPYFETSARDDVNIAIGFMVIARLALERESEEEPYDERGDDIKIQGTPEPTRRKCQC